MRLSEVHDEDVLTPKEVGTIIRKSASYVRKAIASGALPGHRLGPKSILIKGKAIREWIEAHPTNSADSGTQAESSQKDNIASTSKARVDLAVASALR